MTTFSFSKRSEPGRQKCHHKDAKIVGANTGFACPSCGERTNVTDSRADIGGGIRRKRVCACGNGFFTVETFESNIVTKVENERLRLMHKIMPKLEEIADMIDELKAEHE